MKKITYAGLVIVACVLVWYINTDVNISGGNGIANRGAMQAFSEGTQSTSPVATSVVSQEIDKTSPLMKSEIDSEAVVSKGKTFETTEQYEFASRYGRLPENMRDVRIETLSFDEHGALVINEDIKRLTEFFLLARSSEGYEQAIERLNEYFYLTLPELAATQAADIAAKYLLYKENLDDASFSISSDLSDPEVLKDIQKALSDKKALRREYMGEALSLALFGYEEAYDAYSVARIEINTNPALGESERASALAAEEAKLPEELGYKMARQRSERELKDVIAQLKKSGGSEQEIFELRKSFYGESAAKRMAYLESTDPAWQERVNNFNKKQREIFDGKGTAEQKRSEVKALKNRLFSEKEQIKLAVQSIRSAS